MGAAPGGEAQLIQCSRPKQPVARVSQSRKDISLIIEFAIDGGAINREFRMLAMESGDSFGGGDEADEFHAGDAGFFQELIAADALPPVASIGSISRTSVAAISGGSFW